MRVAVRVGIGALLGAWAVVIFHPTTGPWIRVAFQRREPCPAFSENWPSESLEVRAAQNLRSYSAALRTNEGRNPARLRQAKRLSQSMANRHRDNSFWRQMEAVFAQAQGERQAANEAWLHASKRPKWDDFQTDELLQRASMASSLVGIPQSWTLFAAYPLRSIDSVAALKSYARVVQRKYGLTGREALEARVATLRNGELIRDGSRSMVLAGLGCDVVEMASYPSDMVSAPSHRSLLIARYDLINAILASGWTQEAKQVDASFRANDGWTVMLASTDALGHARTTALISVATAVLPGALANVAVAGFVIWFLGWCLAKSRFASRLATTPYAQTVGVLAALAVYWQLRMVVPAIAVAGAFAFLGFAPGQTRKRADDTPDPLFVFIVTVLTGGYAVLHIMMVASHMWAGIHIFPFAGFGPENVGGPGVWASLAGLCLSGLLVVSPTWALVHKLPTPSVLSQALRIGGRNLALTCAVLGLFATLASVPIDRKLYTIGRELVENEPMHFYINP